MNTRNNQRYRGMDICMKAAMLELMQQMDFEKITVKAICERAGVNRGTFYTHYTDIGQMLEEIEEHLNGELAAAVKAEPTGASPFLPYLRYMKRHQYFYRVTLANRRTLPVKKSFRPLWEQLTAAQCLDAGIADGEALSYGFLYFQAGVSAVLQHWIETGCEKSEEELAQILEQCMPELAAKREGQTELTLP